MFILPNPIPGSKATLSDTLTASFLIDRTLTLEIGQSVLVLLSTEEIRQLYAYLERNNALFFAKGEL